MTTEIEQRTSNLPALAPTPALEIGADDVALPRLYLGQTSSDFFKDGLVPAGCIFTAAGKDDPEPNVIVEGEGKPPVVSLDNGPRFYVLGMRRGKSITIDGELFTYAYNDPDVPAEAWTTYNYALAMPGVDPDVPVKFLLTKSGQGTARAINTVLKRNEAKGPPWEIAFQLGTREQSNKKGKWFTAIVRHVEADPAEVEIATNLATMVSGADVGRVDAAATGEEPAI